MNCRRNCKTSYDCDNSCAQGGPGPGQPVPAYLRKPEPREPLKDTNPKDRISSTRLPLHLVPPSLEVYAAIAFAEGQLKYGAYNWRIGGARASVYYSALKRHLAKWHSGEQCDPKTRVPHLASAAACLAVLIDCTLLGNLVDDRPPTSLQLPPVIDDDMQGVLAHLHELIGESAQVRDYTIQDVI